MRLRLLPQTPNPSSSSPSAAPLVFSFLSKPSEPRRRKQMEAALKTYFGYSEFRPYQKEIIEKVLEGRDCLVVMATGSGKSICYQIPPLVTNKTAVVISPLLSLMQDQVMSLKQRGIKAEYLGSTQTNRSAGADAGKGIFDVLYMTPEKACSLPSRFWSNLQTAGICLLAVDEAHCISEWGHDFRTEYKQLHVLRDFLVGVPFVALTATATVKVRGDIVSSLIMNNPYITIGSFDRHNLFYGIKPCNRSMSFIDEFVKEVSKYSTAGGSTIIYCTTVRDTEQIHESLSSAGIKAGIYHGQMGSKAREESHRAFIRDEVLVMVATVAFGMGIDKPDVRCVIHYGCPKSLESYYQESGRCGRDGLPSICWLYYQRSDFAKADFYCSEAKSEVQKKAIMESLMAASKYCLLTTCRRNFLLQYFGEGRASDCGNCDNCTGTKKERDLSKESFLLLSCIKFCGGRWGLNLPIDVLRGSRAKKIVDNNYDKLSVHGLGKDFPPNWWKALGSLLVAHGYLKETVQDTYRFVSVSPKGVKFLSSANTMDETPLVLTLTVEMIDQEEHEGLHHKVSNLQPLSTLESEGFSEDESKLYHMLLDVRMKLARDIGTAPYALCGDQTLRKFAKIRPSTKARLANIDGVNQHFVSCYGDVFIQNIKQLSQELNVPLDYSANVETAPTVPKAVYPNSQRKIGGAKLDAWKMWQNDGLSLQNVANYPGRAAPIKEQTVISYILEAARDGCEISWNRFCEEIGLMLDIASQLALAIAKVGSRDKLKPIKEELPENVSYEMIKTFLTMEDLGLSEQFFPSKPTDEVSAKASESPASCFHQNNTGDCVSGTGAYDTSLSMKKRQSDDTSVLDDTSVKKLQKTDEQGLKYISTLEGTEDAILEWVANHGGASLEGIVEHFNGSNRETVVELLNSLEGNFLIFKKNGCYQVM